MDKSTFRGDHAEFITAIKRHKRTIDHWRYTMAFKHAVSQRSPWEAAKVAFGNWTSFPVGLP